MPNVDQWKGSRLRCLLMTGMPGVEFASLLTWLAQPSGAVVTPDSVWYPRGICTAGEAELVKNGLELGLTENQKNMLEGWWLEEKGRRTPCWDIAATAHFSCGKQGLILIEAKAHSNELDVSGKKFDEKKSSEDNHRRIHEAIREANTCLNVVFPGFNISRDTHYQLSNRFAWAWKLASMGVPVVLIYLGFLNTCEMGTNRFVSHGSWEKAMHDYADSIVPSHIWGAPITVPDGAAFWPLIRSLDIQPQAFIRS